MVTNAMRLGCARKTFTASSSCEPDSYSHPLSIPDTSDAAALDTAERLRAAWRAWVSGAEALLARARPLLDANRHVPGAYDLDYSVGRACAMLGLTPQQVQQRREQVRSGQVRPIEEVRRELRAASRG